MTDSQLVNLFQRARKHNELVVIEGVQAVKHAFRFNAAIQSLITSNTTELEKLLASVGPDVKDQILAVAEEVDQETFSRLSPQPPRTKVIAIAKKVNYQISDIKPSKPLVFLEDPRDLENIGAVIRVAAAADCAAVLWRGPVDPWHPAVTRGAAALQFAIPVMKYSTEELLKLKRPLIALDPEGEVLESSSIAKNSVLIFGTERYGISGELLEKVDQTCRLPMKEKVSSLNLATAVAATVYQLK